MTDRRFERRVIARNLTVTVFDRARANVLGRMEGVEWFEDVEQLRGGPGDPWQDIKADVQLKGYLSDTLERQMPLHEFEFYVGLQHQAQHLYGPVLVKDRRSGRIVFHVQGGFASE